MINLIPPQAKKNLQREYWVRVATVWMLVISCAFAAGAFILIPTYVLVDTQSAAYEQSAAEVSEKLADFELAPTALIFASQQARLVIDEKAVPSMASLINELEQLQGADITLTEISLGRDGKNIAPVRLVGVATDRQSLANFRDLLLAQPNISSVDLPISNLARDRDIQFALTITLVNQIES